jgi:cystathionine beta-synthase
VAQQKGYKLILVVPDKMSREKIFNLKAMGAEVRLTRSDVAKGHPEYYQDMAKRVAEETPGAYFINQFGNPDNPAAHEFGTGPEILAQMDGDLDAIVFGCGSSGTMTGLSRAFATLSPKTELVLADPVGSILAEYINDGVLNDKSGSWLVEGIGEDFLPSIADFSRVTKAYAISDAEAFRTARELLRTEGVLAGSSVGTLMAATLRYCREQTEPKRVVTLICDTGAKYLSKMFSDWWMVDNGFLERKTFGDLRDLIARRHLDHEDYVLSPDMPVQQAIKRMRMYGVSQLAVLDASDRVVGILDESDVLLALLKGGDGTKRPVSDFMTSRLETLPPSASVNDLLPIFRADRVAIVADDDKFHGIITRIDLINFLRKKML